MKKKKAIDSVDRDILRLLHKGKRSFTGNQIANRIGKTPSAINPRLKNLQFKGILKQTKKSKVRIFDRIFQTKKGIITKKIRAPRSVFWDIDLR